MLHKITTGYLNKSFYYDFDLGEEEAYINT